MLKRIEGLEERVEAGKRTMITCLEGKQIRGLWRRRIFAVKLVGFLD